MKEHTTMSIDRASLSRTAFLRYAGIGGGALALGASVGASPAAAAAAKDPVKLRIAYGGGTCEAATYAGVHAGHFAKEGLDVELVKLANSQAGIDALGTGKVDAIGGVLYQYLKPIEQGIDVKLTAGLHGGCLRLIAGKNSGVKTIKDVKGKTVAVDAIGGGSMTFFSAMLISEGLDPLNDVTWRAYPRDQFGIVLERGEAQVVAAGDPFAFLLVQDGKGTQIADNMVGGVYYADKEISRHHFCCYSVIRGGLVRDDPKTAAALTRAWVNSSRWVGKHIGETARIEVDNKYNLTTVETVSALLASYEWHPSADGVLEELEIAAKDFKAAKVLDPHTDPKDLAQRAYIDIYKAAAV
jgi:NitT/TauT family transport system substrate-binding protein